MTLAGNRTLGAPTNATAGQSGVIVVTQDGTGSRTLAYNSVYKFAGGTAPTLTTTASAVDVLAYYVESSEPYYGYFAAERVMSIPGSATPLRLATTAAGKNCCVSG